MGSPVVAYLFDFNGVLVDDERVHFAAFRDVLAKRGVGLDEKTYLERYLAFDDATAFRAMLHDARQPVDAAVVAACVAEKLPLYLAAVEHDLVLFPGAFELVRACAARGPVAIVSGALRVEIDFALERARAADAVKTIVAADDVTVCKPDPAGYLEALRRLAISPADAVVIEDSLAGIEAGHAAGCAVVAVGHSYPLEALRGSPAVLVVERIGDLDVDRLDAVRGKRPPR
ncbi:MAG: HAD family phosphatase [Polyangiales bacterium]